MEGFLLFHVYNGPDLSATLESVMACGGTLQGQLYRPGDRRAKSNWQQILGSGPQVWGTSKE